MATGGGSDSEAGTNNIASDQKIRDSCNACSSHKIRCTKERPACRRCASKGLACEYSISRRNGKRRRSDAPSSLSVLDTTTGIVASAFVPDDFEQLCDMNFRTATDTTDDSWMIDAATSTPHDVDMHYFEPRAFGDHDQPSHDADDTATCVPRAKDIDGRGFGDALSISMPQQTSEGFLALFGQGQQIRGTPGGDITISSLPSRWSDTNAFNAPLHVQCQDCTTLALGIVAQMHVAPKSCSVSDLNSTRCGAQGFRSEVRDIDTVLQANREAIQVLNRILDCPSCSNDHMCLLACYLAAQKTVAWYAAILGIDSGAHGVDLTKLVSARPIYMGTFVLDREAQRLVHTSVTLGEVRDHVQPLVSRLAKLHDGKTGPAGSGTGPAPALPSPTPSNSPSASCGDVAKSQGCALTEQVSRMLLC